jgi:hypothetical protein
VIKYPVLMLPHAQPRRGSSTLQRPVCNQAHLAALGQYLAAWLAKPSTQAVQPCLCCLSRPDTYLQPELTRASEKATGGQDDKPPPAAGGCGWQNRHSAPTPAVCLSTVT